eukprot:2524867-Rhodomonas_salina.1
MPHDHGICVTQIDSDGPCLRQWMGWVHIREIAEFEDVLTCFSAAIQVTSSSESAQGSELSSVRMQRQDVRLEVRVGDADIAGAVVSNADSGTYKETLCTCCSA